MRNSTYSSVAVPGGISMDHSIVSSQVMDALIVAHGVATGKHSLEELELVIDALPDEDQDLVFEGIHTLHQDNEFRQRIAEWRNREP